MAPAAGQRSWSVALQANGREQGARSLLFPLNLYLSFHVPDLGLSLRLLATWRGKSVWSSKTSDKC